MAEFVRGDLITAEKLNQVNNNNHVWNNKSQGDGWKTSPEFYMHSGGYFDITYERFYVSGIGSSEGMKYRIYRFENGIWIAKRSDDIQGAWPSVNKQINISELGGEGWFYMSIWANTATVGNGPWIAASIYSINTNNVKGDFLRYFDKPDNSGNPIGIGQHLTAEILNSGRVMTVPYI